MISALLSHEPYRPCRSRFNPTCQPGVGFCRPFADCLLPVGAAYLEGMEIRNLKERDV